ncbi:MAG: septum formation initiator family protein [Pseudomonadota bacterium]|nr:septum formation initiator family protein [Pseudomonadota bacterium]|tara:strand:+ start:590 stop:895 length:306 start_codon:yes stop_codon:yes gene_type:complete
MQTKFLISLLVILLSILTVKNTWDFYFSASNNSLNNILRKSVIEQSEKNSELLEKNKNLENEIRSMQNNIGFAESYSRENLDMLFPNEVLVEINQKADQDE